MDLPSAIGAQFARPDKLVFALVGDGGFQMSIPELATIANHGLPVKIIVMNNGHLGMVRQWQELFYNNRLCAVQLDGFPDPEKLAGAYGFKGRTVESPRELRSALEAAVREPGPYLLNVRVTPFENVYPMVPAGAAINEMVLGTCPGIASRRGLGPRGLSPSVAKPTRCCGPSVSTESHMLQLISLYSKINPVR